MGNLFCSEYTIHRRFDLKGSSLGRITDKPETEISEATILKDLDLNFIFRLQRSWFQEFSRWWMISVPKLVFELLILLLSCLLCWTSANPNMYTSFLFSVHCVIILISFLSFFRRLKYYKHLKHVFVITGKLIGIVSFWSKRVLWTIVCWLVFISKIYQEMEILFLQDHTLLLVLFLSLCVTL